MSRLKKKLVALAVVFSVGFLSLGFFANGAFSRAALSPLNTSHANLSAIKLASLAKTAGCFVLKEYDELTPRSGNFLTAKETRAVLPQTLHGRSVSFQDHFSSQSFSLHFQICFEYLIFLSLVRTVALLPR